MRWTWTVTVAVALASASTLAPDSAEAQLWKRFVPTTRVESSAGADYTLQQEHGPWLVMAATFTGEGAETQARELVLEFRQRYNLAAYLHGVTFDFSQESPGRGLDEYGAPIRRRYQMGDRVRHYAVLVGEFPSVDDPDAQQLLERIKTMRPQTLEVGDSEKSAQSLAQFRQLQAAFLEKLGKDAKRGPMAQAFLARNPLLPRDFFVPRGVDDFVAKMNRGVESSLLDCPGRYTVQVATFRGKTVLQTGAPQTESSGSFWNRGKADDNPLVEAAENAHLLTNALREHGWEAYEFHDRTESIVTIGSFDQVGQRLANGTIVPASPVQRIIETFGAAYNTPADPLSGIGNDLVTQRRVAERKQQFNRMINGRQGQVVAGMNPKHVKIFKGDRVVRIIPMDVYPHAVEVPRRSISGVYAGR